MKNDVTDGFKTIIGRKKLVLEKILTSFKNLDGLGGKDVSDSQELRRCSIAEMIFLSCLDAQQDMIQSMLQRLQGEIGAAEDGARIADANLDMLGKTTSGK